MKLKDLQTGKRFVIVAEAQPKVNEVNEFGLDLRIFRKLIPDGSGSAPQNTIYATCDGYLMRVPEDTEVIACRI